MMRDVAKAPRVCCFSFPDLLEMKMRGLPQSRYVVAAFHLCFCRNVRPAGVVGARHCSMWNSESVCKTYNPTARSHRLKSDRHRKENCCGVARE